jgi:hemolysin activation/secretion protein
MGDPNKPLNFPELQQRLQVLQLNPNIKRLQAELRPGLLPGEARVDLVIEETPAWSYGLELHNQLPPSVGAEQLDLWLENRNLTGFSDHLSFRYGAFGGGIEETQSAGADNLRFFYSLPVRRDDTTVDFFYDRQGYAIIEEPFTDLDISGSTWNAGLGVRRPLIRDVQDDLWWGLSLARKHSETELLGQPFSVSPGYVDGVLDLTLLKLSLDWLRRTERQVITSHTEVVAGLDAFGATSANVEPDSSFLAIRSNASYLARVNEMGHLLSLRASAQWSDDLLPSPEQWTLGGYSSVRGYRQNEVVRDAGASASVEYRIPVLFEKDGTLNFVTFVDGGVAMDHDMENTESLFSIGIGLTGSYRSWLRGEIFWGIPLSDSSDTGDNLQDQGIHFRLTAGKF